MSFLFKITRQWFDASGVEARLRAAANDASLECAEYIADQARLYAPYDPTRKEGVHLRDTIQVITEAGGAVHHVIATAPHAEPQEFGFIHWISKKFVKPQFYMRRAVQDGAKRFPQIAERATVKQGFHHGRVMGVTIGAR